MAFKKAVKEKGKLRLGLLGLAGSGKTFSALAIGSAIARLAREAGRSEGRIALIDSERGSASLYADRFDFDVAELDSFSPLAYVDKIKEAEAAGYDIIIVDSLSHAWAGKDGALDQKDQAADRGGNSWTAWRSVTPKHNALVDALTASRAHVIATMRQKMEYTQETVGGKTEIKKVGLAAIQREGMEYEFTLVGDIDLTHTLRISKTRCDGHIGIGDLFEKPGDNFAQRVYGWLMSGADPSQPRATEPVSEAAEPVASAVASASDAFLKAIKEAPDLRSLDRAVSGPGKPTRDTDDYNRAVDAYRARKAELQNQKGAAA